MNFFSQLRDGLTKTRQHITVKLNALLQGQTEINADFWDELEAILLQADVGVKATERLLAALRQDASRQGLTSPAQVTALLQQEIQKLLGAAPPVTPAAGQLMVYLVVGVNGTGKTTTAGKLAYYYRQHGYRVMLAAADTFRAAAIDQLHVWAQRAGADIIRHDAGADPAAVAFDAVQAAKARGTDVLLIDTAGRLHTKANLMAELNKIQRVVAREAPTAGREVLLVLDATVGQNAISQARLFHQAVPVDGIALTKLDGTAKGGVVVAVKEELALPVKWIGVGEGADDLRPFDPAAFAQALLG